MAHVWRRVGTGLWVVMAVMLIAVVSVVGLTRTNAQAPVGKELSMPFSEFQPLQARRSVLVIDVRDADSFANGHIPGAIHVPVREVDQHLAFVRASAKGRLIVTYCSCPTEASSLRAAGRLAEAGMKARALIGGFPRWVESGGLIERWESEK